MRVLITGIGGTLGTALAEYYLKKNYSIVGIGHSERSLYDLKRRLNYSKDVKLILGSVVNRELLTDVTRGVDLVIHAAAHKHVNFCEDNPVEAIINNVGGALAVACACADNKVPLVHISTDKAVKPNSAYGHTKRITEDNLLHRIAAKQKVTIARLCNIWGSSGSVIPLWRAQIKAGGPVTITDPNCVRYFITLKEAVATIAYVSLEDPGLYIPKAAPRTMLDIAEELIGNKENIEIKEIGLRPGERLVESVTHGGERIQKTHNENVFQVIKKPDTASDFAYKVFTEALRWGTSKRLHEE